MTHFTAHPSIDSVYASATGNASYLDELMMVNHTFIKVRKNRKVVKPMNLAIQAKVALETRAEKLRWKLSEQMADAMEMGFHCRMERDPEGERAAVEMFNNAEQRLARVNSIVGDQS